jgi:hypothetical protein
MNELIIGFSTAAIASSVVTILWNSLFQRMRSLHGQYMDVIKNQNDVIDRLNEENWALRCEVDRLSQQSTEMPSHVNAVL